MADFAQIKIDTMNDIANAIIENGGADGPIYPREMAAGIRSLATSGGGGGCDCGYNLFIRQDNVGPDPISVIVNDTDTYQVKTYSDGFRLNSMMKPISIYDSYNGYTIQSVTVSNVKKIRIKANSRYEYSYMTFWLNDLQIFNCDYSDAKNFDQTYELSGTTCLFLVSGSCLHPTTEITLPDFSTKQLKDIRVGDKVLSLNPTTNEFEEDTVFATDAFMTKFGDDKDIWTFSDGSSITTIHPHEFYSVDEQKFKYIANFKIGERLLKLVDNRLVEVKLEKHENMVEKTQHATLFTKKNNIYFANGILTGNRNSSKLSIRG